MKKILPPILFALIFSVCLFPVAYFTVVISSPVFLFENSYSLGHYVVRLFVAIDWLFIFGVTGAIALSLAYPQHWLSQRIRNILKRRK